jgi:hypothetical protein
MSEEGSKPDIRPRCSNVAEVPKADIVASCEDNATASEQIASAERSASCLQQPTKLPSLLVSYLPSSYSEFLSANRCILCNEKWLTSWLEIHCQEPSPRLCDDNVVTLDYDTKVGVRHAPSLRAKKGMVWELGCSGRSSARFARPLSANSGHHSGDGVGALRARN